MIKVCCVLCVIVLDWNTEGCVKIVIDCCEFITVVGYKIWYIIMEIYIYFL